MRHQSVPRLLFFLFLSLVSVAAFAQSQATTGVIEGTVTDPSGAILPGVTVTIHNTATNFELDQVTGSAARFREVLLPLGPYEVTASLEGFAKSIQRGINLAVSQTQTL